MTRHIIVIGCGGFGREVLSIAAACSASGEDVVVEGCVDDSPTKNHLGALGALGVQYLGTTSEAKLHESPLEVIVAIGDPGARRRVVERLGTRVRYATLVHPDSTVGGLVDLGPGCVIAPGARLSTQITIGSHVQIDQNATVGHDSVIGSFSRLNPHACVSGSVTLSEGVLVGAAATVLQGLSVGVDSVIGAGSVVTRDVPPTTVVKGIPAR